MDRKDWRKDMEILHGRARDPFDHGFVQALVRKNLSLGEGGTDACPCTRTKGRPSSSSAPYRP